MKAVVTIQMDNQAFEQPYTCMELEKILYKIADTVGRQAIDSVGHECSEADSNGNYIAQWGSPGSGDGHRNVRVMRDADVHHVYLIACQHLLVSFEIAGP